MRLHDEGMVILVAGRQLSGVTMAVEYCPDYREGPSSQFPFPRPWGTKKFHFVVNLTAGSAGSSLVFPFVISD
jgi:hypothetical protein